MIPHLFIFNKDLNAKNINGNVFLIHQHFLPNYRASIISTDIKLYT